MYGKVGMQACQTHPPPPIHHPYWVLVAVVTVHESSVSVVEGVDDDVRFIFTTSVLCVMDNKEKRR